MIASAGERGLLYGAYALLRHLNAGGSATAIDIISAPRIKLRVLNHWDNLDRTVERGYAGQSHLGLAHAARLPSTRATPTMPAPTPRSASTARC